MKQYREREKHDGITVVIIILVFLAFMTAVVGSC